MGRWRDCAFITASSFIPSHQDESDRKKTPFGRQPTVRPPARPFNAEEARQLALPVTRGAGPDGETCLQMGSHRFFNGYVEKAVAFRVRGICRMKDFAYDCRRVISVARFILSPRAYRFSYPLKQTLMVLESMPPLDEVARYNLAANGPDGQGGGGGQGGLSSLMAALPTNTALPKAKFNKGDKVCGNERVREGARRVPGASQSANKKSDEALGLSRFHI